MRNLFLSCVLLLLNASVLAQDYSPEIEAIIRQYLEENDKSGAIRRLQAMVEADSGNYKAKWQYLFYTSFNKGEGPEVGPAMRAIAEDIRAIVKAAQSDSNPGFAFFVQSRYAREQSAYEIALAKIDEALGIAPNSVLYTYAKGSLLVDMGHWKRNDAMVYSGMDFYKKANDLAGGKNPAFFTKVDYHFWTAWSYCKLSKCAMCSPEALAHYKEVVKLNPKNQETLAFAWNNMSCSYRKMRQCDKAREVAENALKIMKFGAAEQNLHMSENCIQMQKIGIMPGPETPGGGSGS